MKVLYAKRVLHELTLLLALLSILMVPPLTGSVARGSSIEELPCIPLWAIYGDTLTEGSAEPFVSGSDVPGCPQIFGTTMPTPLFAHHYDEDRKVTMLFSGDFPNDRVVLYEIDSMMGYVEKYLPIPEGLVWLATDLDRDGNVDLVLQRGDFGFGGNGYLDIVSAPNWDLRTRLVFPGMKVYMYPIAVNVDQDRFSEIYLTPTDMGAGALAVLVDYDSVSGEFVRIAETAAPTRTGGDAAVGDFDNDGKTEFISGNDWGYGLFEYDGDSLAFIDHVVRDSIIGLNQSAAAVKPLPSGEPYAFLGHSSGENGFRYQLIRAVGNNEFQVSTEFQRFTGKSGVHTCSGFDIDCDGLDELVMSFYPLLEVMEWDVVLQEFVPGCTWSRVDLGILTQYAPTDLNQDGAMEWSTINPLRVFRTFEDERCLLPCSCPCEGDPECDGLTDLLDVMNVIDVAFFEVTPFHAPRCPRVPTDVDCNGVTNVLDVVRFVNAAFRNEDPATYFCHPCE